MVFKIQRSISIRPRYVESPSDSEVQRWWMNMNFKQSCCRSVVVVVEVVVVVVVVEVVEVVDDVEVVVEVVSILEKYLSDCQRGLHNVIDLIVKISGIRRKRESPKDLGLYKIEHSNFFEF